MKKKMIWTFIICINIAAIIYASVFIYNRFIDNSPTKGYSHSKTGIDEQKTSRKGLLIKKYRGNQTAFQFVSSKGVTIISDPCYLDGKVRADAVTEANDHIDHTETSLITGKYKLIRTTGEFEVKGIHIYGYSGINSKGDNWESNIIYVYDIDGVRIAQFASQGAIPDGETLNKIGNVDILIVQVIDYPTKMGVSEVYEVIKRLNPKIVIPAHGNQDLNPELAAKFEEDAEYERSGIITITRETLDKIATPKILVLDNGDEGEG